MTAPERSEQSIKKRINELVGELDQALLADRQTIGRELDRIQRRLRRGSAGDQLQARCNRLGERIKRSAALRRQRLQNPPSLQFDPALPITACKDELIDLIREHPVIIVAGETGSGKTTQLPKICLAAGRGVDGLIGLTQPRRIAAVSVSRRIAEELQETPGQTVGHKIRFQDSTADHTRIKVMTDGILLAETHADRFLNAYDTLIIDEAHERSLNIDFILGLLKELLKKRRDLKVIITSATIDTQKFSRAFDDAPVVEVSGRMYPVQTRYMADDAPDGEESTHIEQAVQAVEWLSKQRPTGDILAFMPTEQDIRDTCDLLEGRRFAATRIIPLFARLSAAEQQKVFQTGGGRRIIVATNVAETSITIPGIHCVVDTGLARISQYTPRSRTTTLPVVPVSRSSADQRQGRCGRVADGLCVRLYSEADYNQRPRFTAPEILRSNLADVILRMIALKLGGVEDFPFIDPPAGRSVQDGYNLLLELGAISLNAKKAAGRADKYVLTPKGRLMARLPLDPRLSSMLIEAHNRGCLDDVAIIAAALSIQDPRERPAEKQTAADRAQARFSDPASDFMTLLNIWHTYRQIVEKRRSWAEVKGFCHEHFLSFRRMREWQDIYLQIRAVLAEHDIRPKQAARAPEGPGDPADSWYAAVHQSILSGFLSNIATRKEKQIFTATYGRQVMIFPGSGLFKNPGSWIVAAEMVETSRLFARCAAVIDPAWVEAVGRPQCQYTYLDPHWEKRREQVMATEQVSLYGLIVDRRPCAYGAVNPQEATEIFIHSALIQGDVQRPLPFMKQNLRLAAQVEQMQDRLRRKDLLVDESVLLQFYSQRLENVFDMRGLNHRIRKAGSDRFLRLRREDLLNYQPDSEELDRYPTAMTQGRQRFACEYRYDPGEENDGVTVRVPAAAAASVAPETFQWLVPGLLKEKIAVLVKGLPKELRKQLVPLADTLDIILAEMPPQRETSLINALSRFIERRFQVAIPAAAWDESVLPDHLRMRIAITDSAGRVLRSSRDAGILQDTRQSPALPDEFKQARARYERTGIHSWDFGDLPDTVILTSPAGRRWTAYPALEVRGTDIVLTAFAESARALKTHPAGVKALLLKQFAPDVKYLHKNLKLPQTCEAAARYFGGIKALDRMLIERIEKDLFEAFIRTRSEYENRVSQLLKGGIAGRGQQLRHWTIDIINAYHECRVLLHAFEERHPGNSALHAFLSDLRQMLHHLVPEKFISLYSSERLQHVPRFIRALCTRAERGMVNLEKDRAKERQVEPYRRRLEEFIGTLTPQSSEEKRRQVEDLFWMLEEYKISIFAQEIKTSQPVSAKRLGARIRTIEGLV